MTVVLDVFLCESVKVGKVIQSKYVAEQPSHAPSTATAISIPTFKTVRGARADNSKTKHLPKKWYS